MPMGVGMWHVNRSFVVLTLISLSCFALTLFPHTGNIGIGIGIGSMAPTGGSAGQQIREAFGEHLDTSYGQTVSTVEDADAQLKLRVKVKSKVDSETFSQNSHLKRPSGPLSLYPLAMIYFITPTYKRLEQVAELTRLSQTLMHIPSLTWILVEDAKRESPRIRRLLQWSNLTYVHLHAAMPASELKKKQKARGVSNRNRGVEWVLANHKSGSEGVVYFADDDNTYDLRLFDEIRSVKKVGMWPVGLITNFGMSSPIVRNGSVVGFYDGWVANRKFPVDMAGFAVNVNLILKAGKLNMPFMPFKAGYEEDGFLKRLNIRLQDIEPKADNCTKILVWHTQTKKNKGPKSLNQTVFGTTNIATLYKTIS